MIHAMRTMARAVAAASALLVPLSCCAPVAQAQTVQHARLSAQVVNNAQRTMLTGAAPLVAHYGKDQGSLTATEPLQSMKLVLRRGAAEQAAMKDFLAQVQNPASASYHKWLTPEQFGQRFGASSDDIAAITAWLQQQGFSIDSVSRSRTVVTFSGTEAQFQNAFQAEMHRYLMNDQVRIANADTPSVPAALAPAIVGLATLGNARFVPTHTSPIRAQRDATGRWHKQDASAVKAQATAKVNPQVTERINGSYYVFVGPADFAQMYGIKSVWSQGYKGAGQSVAIVAESNIATSDVDAFRAAFGLPATKLNVTVIGDDPGLSYFSGAEGEAVLDVEWAGATAPEADINLLVAASTATDEGILIAAEYAIDNNLSPVLNLSWGSCELGLQESGNQYFDDLWAQAAAQGISVIVASGDGGAVACDQNEYYAAYGQQINGMASTENSTAIGGTDFPINVSKAGTYWSQTNDPTTLQSAKSYVPESVWNDSCASPDVLANVAAFGLSEITSAEICNDEYAFLNTVGGGGGVSLCTSSDGADQSSCTGGHDAPAWQQSISGIGATGKRHIPDVSFFAGAGTWASAYAFCEADASTDDGDCVNNQGVITTLGAGGTSFGAPAFAGIVALLNQQQGARQGNLNKYLYALAAKQFANPVQSASCQSADGNSSEDCTFHDVIQGSNAEPCKLRTLVDLTTQTTCTAQGQYDWVGIAAGYSAAAGYDPATGLGSVNAANLLAAWSSATAADAGSVTTHTLTTATTQMYGSVAAVEINVKAAAGSAVPSGTVALMSSESSGSTLGVVSSALDSGAAHVQFNSLVPGTHHLYASYGGDASFGASTSTPTEFVVTRAATSLAASASNTSVVAPNSVTILAQIGTDSTALNPTGTLVFTNHATGAVLGTTTLTPLTSSSGASWSQASMKLPGTALASGNNVIDVSYAGDGNYLAAANASVAVHYTGAYSIASSSSSLDIDVSGSKQASATITVGSGNGTKIDPASLLLACQGLSTTGVTCAFTAPVLDASGDATSTLTVTANNPQTSAAAARQSASPAIAPGAGTLALGGLLLLWSARQRRRIIGMFGMLALVFSTLTLGVTTGCGSSSHKATSTAVTNQLSVSSGTASYGTAVTFTSTVSAVSNTFSPSGTVLFYDGSTPLGSATVSGGKAQLSVSTLAVGKHTITASYSGDSTFMPSASGAASVNVTLSTTLNVTVSDTSGNVAQLALPVLIH